MFCNPCFEIIHKKAFVFGYSFSVCLTRQAFEHDMNSMVKKPSAWVPIAVSLTVLAIMLIHFAVSGIPVRETDEGTAAHLFQIWLGLEVLMVGFFAIKWLPQRPKQALAVLTMQIVAALAACAPVFYFNL